MPQTGIVQGMQPIVGYNFGQKKFERAKKSISLSLGATIIYGLLASAICLLIPTTLISLLSHENTIVAQGKFSLQLFSLAYPVNGVALLVAAYFQSIGKAKEALFLTLGGIFLVRLPILLLNSRFFALNGI